ncbi:STAS domain-containing protein [Actinoplanes sp. CA-252034]|uniref:STAS domain-containing protein n=1 Tax=Actinoplanes sp. CA-252034 TaxID=3239906 RepID=UPI003D98EC9A
MSNIPLWTASVTAHDTVRTVSLTGELDLTAADELFRLLCAELDTPGAACVVADLAEVTFLDSAALGAFIGVHNHAGTIGRQFHVINAARPVRRILDITGVYEILAPRSSGD